MAHPHGGSQTSVAPVLGDPRPLLASLGARYACGADTDTQANTCAHEIKIHLLKKVHFLFMQ